MKTTRENIKNRIEEINKELEKITKLDKKFPQGELQCFKNENRYKWKVKEESGQAIKFTPMQHQLMQLFFNNTHHQPVR